MSSFGETSTGGFAQYALREGGEARTGIQSSRALNGGRIGNRPPIAHRLAFLIARFCGPDSNDLGFAGFRRPIGLLARTGPRLLGRASVPQYHPCPDTS